MKTSILSLLIAATLSVTGIHQASANNALTANNSATTRTNPAINNSSSSRSPFGEPSFKGSENFAKAFPEALVKSYETTDGRTKVTFSWNGDALEAFYDNNGNLIATTHFLDNKNLPVSILMKVRDNYAGYTLLQSVEFYHTESGLAYFVMIKKGEKGLIVKVDTNGGISIVKRLAQ
ncbi:MAG: hypothetical protein P4L51_09940 [Puia sp.]|nr:hypothetical protein [Puia sp.]